MKEVAVAIKTLHEYLSSKGYEAELMGKQQLAHLSIKYLRKENGYFSFSINTEGISIAFKRKISNPKVGEVYYEDTVRKSKTGDWTVNELVVMVSQVITEAKLV